MTDSKKSVSTLASIQALKALAFLGILAYHCGLLPVGPLAVSVFFVISGFCMYYSSSTKGKSHQGGPIANLKNATHHVSKLYPLHLLFIAVVLLRIRIVKHAVRLNIVRILLDGLLLTSWFPPSLKLVAYNEVAWYLSTAFFLYFCYGWIYRWLSPKSQKRTFLWMGIVYGLQILFAFLLVLLPNISQQTANWLTYEFPLFRLGDFILGCCLGKIFVEKKDCTCTSFRASVMELLGVVFAGMTLLIYVLKIGILGEETIRRSVLLIPSVLVLVYLFAVGKGWITKLLTNRPLLWIAALSPYGFLIHRELVFDTKLVLFDDGEWGSLKEKVIVCLVSLILTILLSVLWRKGQTLFRKRT